MCQAQSQNSIARPILGDPQQLPAHIKHLQREQTAVTVPKNKPLNEIRSSLYSSLNALTLEFCIGPAKNVGIGLKQI